MFASNYDLDFQFAYFVMPIKKQANYNSKSEIGNIEVADCRQIRFE